MNNFSKNQTLLNKSIDNKLDEKMQIQNQKIDKLNIVKG